MNIEKEKLKKYILIILLMFIAVIILPGFISSLATNVNAYEFKSISNQTWKTDEGVGRLYEYLYNIDKDSGSLPSYEDLENKNLGLGTSLGSSLASETSFNRLGCLFDLGNNSDMACNVICYEPGVSTFSYDESQVDIQQILFVTPTNVSFYKLRNSKKECTTPSTFNYQKWLSVAYRSQSEHKTAVHFADYIRETMTWKNTLEKALGSEIEFDQASNNDVEYLKWNEYGASVNEYQYSGIFVFYSVGGSKCQGRMAYRVVREEKTQPVELTFKKTDFSGKALSGAGIIVKGTVNENNIDSIDGRNSGGYLKYKDNGIYNTITVYPRNNTGTFYLALRETEAPSGYAGLPGVVMLTVEYDTSTGQVKKITSNKYSEYVPTTTSNTVIIKNKPKVNLVINKTDSLTGAKLANARFKIELTNVESMEKYQIPQVKGEEKQNSPTVVYVKTDNNGQIKLTGIVPRNGKGTITATITEVEVPTANGYYYKEIEPITVKMTYNNGTWTEDGVGSISGNTVTVPIKNQPYIKLSGMVWEDGQIGVKDVTGPNGKKDSGETGLANVLVALWSIKDKEYKEYVDTDENGMYAFTDIPKTNEGYKIKFSYDGINWQETKSIGSEGKESKASESNAERTAFNDKFKTIVKDKSIGVYGDETDLQYNTIKGAAYLLTNMDGKNPANGYGKNTDFRMNAETEKYTTTTENVDCGLVKKELDLAVGTDVEEATLKINDKETTYSYAQIMDGEMEDLTLDDILQNNSSTSKEDIKYNLYLYTSDYNYRIKDYQTGINNNVNDDNYDYNADDTLKELEAYVTYSVILKNKSTYNATVDEFVYYYDAIYEPCNIVSTDKYNVSIDKTNRKITFTSIGNGLNVNKNSEDNNINNDYRNEIELTFKLDITSDAYKNLITTSREAKNAVEITKYSTDIGGLIDKDSAPGNANVKFENGTPKVGQYEDDTDEAKGINISLRTESRTITGTVFEDTDKDGKLNNKNGAVNDVIVQLIEIKQENGNYFEYIWQETRSGSNTVKTTARNGYEGTTYTNSVQTGSGQYEFKDFIPGNYIVRFIYGDGRTLDVNSEAYKNTTQYNGQDYKSTVDKNYKEPYYNTSTYEDGASVARDNEARRLEVMAYSSTINEEVGKALEEKTSLDKTWMAAETSRINVPVDADDLTTTENSTESSVKESGMTFTNVHFGLALRPQTKLVLEKHITGLKITPAGTGVQSIIDAKANIENIVNGKTVEISGVTDGLAVIYANRGNRGFWQVATDIEELAQGASLEVEYTYVLRNDGEKDYLSSTLVQEYEKNVSDYSNYLLNIVKPGEGNLKNKLKGNTHKYGTYLGEYYYTGDVGTSDAEVSSRIETLEEAINNDLIFDEGTDFKKINEEAISKNVYDRDGNLVNNVENGTKNINTVVQSTSSSKFLTPKAENAYTEKTADWSKTITLRTTLASVSGGELGANLPSYIAEITKYSNAAGRRDMSSEPANLSYVHSDDNEMTLANSGNEEDEFWAETIIITKPTGEDKLTPMQIVIIAISSIAVIGVGIVLIKKFVLKK